MKLPKTLLRAGVEQKWESFGERQKLEERQPLSFRDKKGRQAPNPKLQQLHKRRRAAKMKGEDFQIICLKRYGQFSRKAGEK